MTTRLIAFLLVVAVVACTPSDPGAGETTAGSPGSTTGSTSTTPPSTTTTVPEVPPDIVFDEVDRGVLVDLRRDEEPSIPEPAPLDPAGDRLDFLACRTTWFGNYEFEFEYEPGESAGTPSTRSIGIFFLSGDQSSGALSFEVDLDTPGRFVIPVPNFALYEDPGSREIAGQPSIIDQSDAFTCVATVGGPEPLSGSQVSGSPETWLPLRVEIKPPSPIHPGDSLQGTIERMDPTDPDEPYRPLAALAGLLPQFPMDVVYVLPDMALDGATLEDDGACLNLDSRYLEGPYIAQHAGCFDGFHAGVAVDDVWSVELPEEIDVESLVPLRWVGHPGVDVPANESEYLEERVLPEGATEIYRTEVAGFSVAVVHWLAPDGTASFALEGVGDNSGGGGFPGEIWNGCYQVQHRDSGYTAIVVDDPTWLVMIDDEPVTVEEAGNFGVAVIPQVVRQPHRFEVTTADGAIPACVAG